MYCLFVLTYLLLILFPQRIVCKTTKNFLFTSDTRREICVNKHPGYSFLLANDMKCMEDKIKSMSPQSLSLLKACWKEITGVEPKQDEDYAEVYCRDESPYILVNMVHDCFLRNFVRDRVEEIKTNGNETMDRMETVKDLYRPVDEVIGAKMCDRPPNLDSDLPKSEIIEFVECMEVGPDVGLAAILQRLEAETHQGRLGPMGRVAVKYFETIYELDDRTIEKQQDSNYRSYCQDDLQLATEQIKCLKEKISQNVTILRKCFKDITSTSYEFPESDAQIKGYLCDNQLSYPMALMSRVEECAIRRTFGPDQYFENLKMKRCISLDLLDDDDDRYSRFVADDIQIVYHNNICQRNNVSAVKEWIFEDEPTHGMACVSDKFKKEYRGKSNAGRVIDYCWNYLMSHGQFVNSTVKEIPNSNEEWMKFFCSHDYYNKRIMLPSLKPVNSCMERMLRLDSRSVIMERTMRRDPQSGLSTLGLKISDPQRSEDEETMMRCLQTNEFEKELSNPTRS